MPIGNVRIVISAPADRDLGDIWLAIAPDDAATATRLVRDIGAKLDYWPRIRASVRAVTISAPGRVYWSKVRISFFTKPIKTPDDGPIDEVEVVRVVDGRRDLTSPF